MRRIYRVGMLVGLAAGGIAALLVSAQAQSTIISTPRGTVTILRSYQQVPRDVWGPDLRTQKEIDARNAAWEARCQPVIGAPDRNGVARYIYRAPGCEFGD